MLQTENCGGTLAVALNKGLIEDGNDQSADGALEKSDDSIAKVASVKIGQ